MYISKYTYSAQYTSLGKVEWSHPTTTRQNGRLIKAGESL